MLKFGFFFKRSFRYENVDEKLKTERSFMKTIAFIKSLFFLNTINIPICSWFEQWAH